MVKLYLFRKIPFIFGAFWLFSRRKVLVDRVLIVMTQKVFSLVGKRFPKLSFLKFGTGQI